MCAWFPVLSVLLSIGPVPVETKFAQVAPLPIKPGNLNRAPGQARAVILIHGLHLHPFHTGNPARPEFRPWQMPRSPLVRALSKDSDVFAFSYGQTVTVDVVAAMPDLAGSVRRLRELGYSDVVLVGFSAGGLIVRQYIEDEPDPGVTKVIQVCTPNSGSGWAKFKAAIGPGQEVFLQSLTRQSRMLWLRERQQKTIPERVQFACVVGNGLIWGDGMVSTRSQWPEDLQKQGIPAVTVSTDHHLAVSGERGAQVIARLVREDLTRWGPVQVAAMRKRLWGERASAKP
jgi:pimeloyl-ACP methyl ester carboxylesterase